MLSFETLFRGFVDAADGPQAALGRDGRVFYANAALLAYLGREGEYSNSLILWDYVASEDRPRTQEQILAWLHRGGTASLDCEVRWRTCAGVERIAELRLHHCGGADSELLFATLYDLTSRRELERRILEEQTWCRTVLSSVLDPVITIDARGVIQSASDSVERVFGWSAPELVGRNVNVLMPEPHRSGHDAYLARHLATGRSEVLGRLRQFPVVRKDGCEICCELAITRFFLPGRAEPFFSGSFRDITARLRAEEEIRDSERMLRVIFEREHEFRVILDPTGNVLRINRASRLALDAEPELAAKSVWELAWWSDHAAAREQVRAAVARAARGGVERLELPLLSRRDGWITVELAISPIRDEDQSLRFLILEAHDVTRQRESRQAEQTMLQAFAEIGESAAEVIHEIKNPISGIHVALCALAQELGQDEREVLEDLASRLRTLEQRLRRTLQFARPAPAVRRSVSAAAVFARAIEETHPAAAGRGLSVEMASPALEASCLGDPELLNEALVNLLLNAVESGARRIRASVEMDLVAVRFIVEDDGPGVPDEKSEAIFKPFITTKLSGSGIGLALVLKSARAHGGSVQVTRGELGGARFVLTIPQHFRLDEDESRRPTLTALSG